MPDNAPSMRARDVMIPFFVRIRMRDGIGESHLTSTTYSFRNMINLNRTQSRIASPESCHLLSHRCPNSFPLIKDMCEGKCELFALSAGGRAYQSAKQNKNRDDLVPV